MIANDDSLNEVLEIGPEAGFSLLEILVALGILAVGLSSVFALFIAGTAAHRRAIDRYDVSQVAEQVFTDLESTIQSRWQLANGDDPFEFLEALENDPPIQEAQRKWPDYDLELKLLPVQSSEDTLVARLNVKWRNRGSDRTEVFEQVLLFSRGPSDDASSAVDR